MGKHGIAQPTAALSKFSRFLCQRTVPWAVYGRSSYLIVFPGLVTFVSNFVLFGGNGFKFVFP